MYFMKQYTKGQRRFLSCSDRPKRSGTSRHLFVAISRRITNGIRCLEGLRLSIRNMGATYFIGLQSHTLQLTFLHHNSNHKIWNKARYGKVLFYKLWNKYVARTEMFPNFLSMFEKYNYHEAMLAHQVWSFQCCENGEFFVVITEAILRALKENRPNCLNWM